MRGRRVDWPDGVPESDERREGAAAKPVLVLRKVRAILDCFTAEKQKLSFSQLRQGTGLPPSTCARLLQTMVEEGFLDRVGDLYTGGISLVRWASTRTADLGLARVAEPILAALRDETGETSRIYVRDGLVRVCVAMAETRHSVVRVVRLGQVLPLHAGGGGKLILAYEPDVLERVLRGPLERLTGLTLTDPQLLREELREIRSRGYAMSFGERDTQSSSVLAPFFGASGEFLGAIGIGAPIFRLDHEAARKAVPAVLRAGRRLSAALGYVAPQGPGEPLVRRA